MLASGANLVLSVVVERREENRKVGYYRSREPKMSRGIFVVYQRETFHDITLKDEKIR